MSALTKGDEKLVSSDEGTSDLAGHGLRLVKRDGSRKGTDTKTSHETANSDLVPGVKGSALNNDTNIENDRLDSHGPSSTKLVSDGGTEENSNGGTSAEERDKHALNPLVPVRVTGLTPGEPLSKVLHLGETRDLTSVPSEEETSHGGEDGDEDCQPSDWRATDGERHGCV